MAALDCFICCQLSLPYNISAGLLALSSLLLDLCIWLLCGVLVMLIVNIAINLAVLVLILMFWCSLAFNLGITTF